MRRELDILAEKVVEPEQKVRFSKEMDDFSRLFQRFLTERSKQKHVSTALDWSKINSPADDQIINYNKLDKVTFEEATPHLSKLAVLKLNGGLGTTMGCIGPKSAIEVRDGYTFLDLTVHQIEHLNEMTGAQVPLVLMNSFNTDEDTSKIVQKYSDHNVDVLMFNQSRYPRILKDQLLPLPRNPDNTPDEWYPPGHGDLYESFANSGLLDKLIEMGKEYVFVSNVDNLGATVNPSILMHMVKTESEFLMEVTDKTKADIKGGTLIDYDGNIRLLEIAQVPPQHHVDDFKSIKKFKIFNTNNLWINLKAIKRVVDKKELDLEVIINNKVTKKGQGVIQLETAVGAAIKHFSNAHGVNVPRSRFLPVKSTSDLFIVMSDLYSMENGYLVMNSKRMFQNVPLVKLGSSFTTVSEFLSRFKSPPHILELDHLTVTGDVTFGSGVVLQGTVIIVANHGNRIDIPSGAILNDKVVSGNLRILDH
ncbi:UTP-glucose-1-phosphate uridylyltransferase [Ramicandelaber brevisporus]|nr:UTP-glucose-1-phosphate uridylyltransferase [Ramicandelaber brevisporus]